MKLIAPFLLSATSLLSLQAQDPVELDRFEVQGRGSILVGEAITASEGTIGRVDLEVRPMLRTGEILEAVPGMVVTQHSGSGKANQYFLRGFNLDHGTDFATWIDGMPVNMVSHGHGQGYTDINFIIPEMVETITYQKGSYYADVGDFSSAGSATLTTTSTPVANTATLTLGQDNYFRAVATGSSALPEASLVYGLERTTDDGPWDLDEELDRYSGQIKFLKQLDDGAKISLNAMAYSATWNATDQIPQRAVSSGQITPFGFIDDTVGGDSSRFSLSGQWKKQGNSGYTEVSAYSIYYDMNLWSNFTYFLDNPTDGDQFQQSDKRMIYGASFRHVFSDTTLFGKSTDQTIGAQARFDDIANVGLYNTKERQIIGTNREDEVKEHSLSLFYEASTTWNPNFRTTFGTRIDSFAFDVESDFAPNSGNESDYLISPKFNAIYSLSESTEYYASAGYSFHSNDSRGATISIDPADRQTPVDSVDLLVRSFGYEIGLRHNWSGRNNTSIALWSLELDSELLYVGDAGNTEITRPSQRYGLEIANYLTLSDGLTLDLDLAFTDASYRASEDEGREIPGAIDSVASVGLSYQTPEKPWFGSIRYRHFSERPLEETGSVRSDPFDSVNLKIGYKAESWKVSLDVLNALDSDDHDITYFYESRLPGEGPDGVADRHFHIIPPTSLRLNVSKLF